MRCHNICRTWRGRVPERGTRRCRHRCRNPLSHSVGDASSAPDPDSGLLDYVLKPGTAYGGHRRITPVKNEDASVENRQLRDTIQSIALHVLGRARRQHQDWFNDNDAAIKTLLVEKNWSHKSYIDRPNAANKTAFYRSRRLVKHRLREMQEAWMARKAEELQGYSDRNEWKNFFAATKAICGPPVKGASPLFSADGTTQLTEKSQILKRWAEYFRSVLNQPFNFSTPHQVQRYKDTLKHFPEANADQPGQLEGPHPAWRKTVKTRAAIYEANRISDKRAARKSAALRTNTTTAKALPNMLALSTQLSRIQCSAEAAGMEVIQDLVRVDGLGLRSVKECRQADGLVHLQYGVQVNTTGIPHGGLQPAEDLTGFEDPLRNLFVHSRVA
ncbi:unnamed protein product [Schistocephalus solidus]|uniref:Uncharacterized protein n=1 Tax=Schistocephalus solidus TaxID=70667 RepID=A0A183T673_SCHSO|nr:unnamed protein product [Schistocephalus solidus]